MKTGYSTLHAFQFNEEFVRWTAERLASLEYTRFELCMEGLGLDRFIRYTVLEKLNDHKPYLPEAAEGLRRVLEPLKQAGKEIAAWTHELNAPSELLDVYPELRTARGDVNLAHPLMREFLTAKYEQVFRAVPQIDIIVLSMTEVPYAVAHRFDSAWPPEDCIHWLIDAMHQVCRKHGRRLVVRPFSAIVADYEAARRALARLPDDIEIMDKSDPFDWDAHLPINPELETYAPERLTVEFDLGSEYFGRGALPVIHPEYLKDRLDKARALGVHGVMGRLDRRGLSALDREGRLNVEFFDAYANNPALAIEPFLQQRASAHYRTSDPAGLVAALREGFEVVNKMFYVDGHLLFHSTFGNLRGAQLNVLFETLRPNQPMDHCSGEWAILSERTTPSIAQARGEKEEAVALARDVRRRLARIAPDEPQLQEHGENLELLAELYRATAVAIQEYIGHVKEPGAAAPSFAAACDDLDAAAKALLDARGPDWLTRVPATAVEFAADLRRAFFLEKKVYAEKPGLDPAELSRLEDMIAAGYPGEGHRLRKFTHGSRTQEDGKRFWRIVGQHAGYTLSTGAGPRCLRFHAAGDGDITLAAGGKTLARHEWSHGANWSAIEVPFTSPGGAVDLTVRKVTADSPELGMFYLLKGVGR